MASSQVRPKLYYAPKLFERERELLRTLADGIPDVPDRYHAFKELVPIIESLDLEHIKGKKRRPLKLSLPLELDEAIRAKSEQTGQPYIQVLLEAARKYREQS